MSLRNSNNINTNDNINNREVENLVAVIGSGGTGSYLIEPLITHFNNVGEETYIKLIDGDVLEERNLERQAFLNDEIGLGKSEAVANRLQNRLSSNVSLEGVFDFIQNARVFLDLFDTDYSKVKNYVIISCVDNMNARLRMTLGVHILHRYFERNSIKAKVVYIDSGNTEFTGQTISTVMESNVSSGNTDLKEYLDALIDKKPYINKAKRAIRNFENFNERHDLKSIFTGVEDWENNLTKADHEISCDVIAESAPQNILVNQVASVSIHNNLNNILDNKSVKGVYTTFNTKNFNIQTADYNEDYNTFFKEMLVHSLTPEGTEVLYDTRGLLNNG